MEDTQITLVNVKALSSKRCAFPIAIELKYATLENFVGAVIPGYDPEHIYTTFMTYNATEALCAVQKELNKLGFGLLIFDAYRPKKSVEYFWRWAHKIAEDKEEIEKEKTRRKEYYPTLVTKKKLFEEGYVAKDSGHCYGNTVDVVLIKLPGDLKKWEELKNKIIRGKAINFKKFKVNMGACFDFMDKRSHITSTAKEIGEKAYFYRIMLQKAMEKYGFEPYEKEFWHFSHGGKPGREVTQPIDVDMRVLNLGRIGRIS